MNKVAKPPAEPAAEPAAPVFWRVVQAAHELESRMEAALAVEGLSMAKAGLLRLLAQADDPVALSDLAEHSQCVRSNITQLMDRLESDGLVRRVADPADRRVRRAALTAAGRKAYQEAVRIIQAQEKEVAGALSREEAKALGQALGRLAS
jgi:DNA-binding MarR family transcriptional regulator